MPIYDYECGCGKRDCRYFSIANRNTPVKCECGEKMNRLVGRFAILGWAETRGLYDMAANTPDAADRNIHWSLAQMEKAGKLRGKYAEDMKGMVKKAQVQAKQNGWRPE